MGVYHIFGYTFIAGVLLSLIFLAFRKPQNWFIEILTNWVGALFIFSGGVKAIDPLGTSYKIAEYFGELNLNFLEHYALAFSIFTIVLELALGMALIVGWKRKLTAYMVLGLMIFFTFLTGYTYLSGYDFTSFVKPSSWVFDELKMKVTDCGCFGDFIKLHPRTSFHKDIVLSILGIIILIFNQKKTPLFKGVMNDVKVYGFTLFSLLFCIYNFWWNLPVVDFRPYKVGNDLNALRIPEKEAKIEFTFVYKNKETGEEKDFDVNNLPKEGWDYVTRHENVLDPGIPAKIENFYMENADGEEVTEDVLHDENYSFWVVMYDIDKCHTKALGQINELAKYAQDHNYNFYGVSGNSTDDFRHANNLAFPMLMGDGTFLKTIIRSDPGLVLLKNGVVLGKWHYKHLPSTKELETKYLN